MRFTPIQNDEDLQNKDGEVYADEIFDCGEYEFKVVSAQAATSKAGNDMIKLAIAVFNNGSQVKVYDYLLEAMKFKLKHFCEATRLDKKYYAGVLTPQMCIGSAGRLKLTIQVDDNGKYPDKNIVEDYCREIESEEIEF